MMTRRTEQEIRADLDLVAARVERKLPRYTTTLGGTEAVAFRLAADVGPLLDRLSAAEAENERLRLEKQSLADHAGSLLTERANFATEASRLRAVVAAVEALAKLAAGRLVPQRDDDECDELAPIVPWGDAQQVHCTRRVGHRGPHRSGQTEWRPAPQRGPLEKGDHGAPVAQRDDDEALTGIDPLLESAWGVIANAGGWDDPNVASPGWREAAERWRDEYHARLSARGRAITAGPAPVADPTKED